VDPIRRLKRGWLARRVFHAPKITPQVRADLLGEQGELLPSTPTSSLRGASTSL